MELREFDDVATGVVLCAIDDAICHEGLLKHAILQLQTNFENAGKQANKTWMGRLDKVARVIWPRFRVQTMPNLHLSGVLPRDPNVKFSKQFIDSARIDGWKSVNYLPLVSLLHSNKRICCS